MPRATVAVALTVAAAIFVALAFDTFWFQRNIVDTESFVDRVSELPSDPAVSAALALTVVEALDEGDAFRTRLSEALPDQLEFLSPALSRVAVEVVFDTTRALIESEAFASVWVVIAGSTHRAVIATLEGPAEAIVFDLDAGADFIVERLGASGVEVLIDPDQEFGVLVLASRETLEVPRRVARALSTARWVFPIVAAILLGLAVLIDRDRLRPLQVGGFAVAGALLVSAALLALARSAYISGGRRAVDEAARRAVWDALTEGYVLLAALVAAIGVLVGIGVWWYRRSRATPA